MIRRSRCLALLAILLVMNFAILSLLNYDPEASLQQNIRVNLFDVRRIMFKDDSTENPEVFNELLDSKFNHIYHKEGMEHELSDDQKKQLWLLDVSKNEKDHELVLPDYMVDPDAFESPNLHVFDPRFTLNFVFNNLRRQIKKSGSVDKLVLPYFHWADWVDLATLNEHFLSDDKQSCKEFDLTTKSDLRNRKMELQKAEEFCIDDEKIEEVLNDNDADPVFKELLKLIQGSELSTGFHVFQYGGRSRKKFKVLQAKSYLHDFMPPPMSLVFILPGSRDENGNKLKSGGTGLQVEVTQDTNNRVKIADTSLVPDFIKDFRREYREVLHTSKDIIINIDQELARLNDMVKEKIPVPGDSVVEYERVLAHEQFKDNSSDILAALEKVPDDSLTEIEKLYRLSLRVSLNEGYPPKYFNEAKIIRKESNFALGGHYDWRFFNGIINYTEKQAPSLHGLIRAWLTFTNTYNLNTWIAHGSLLSWYWNGVGFPWDNDIDVQMPIADLHMLSRKFNQSIIMDLGDGDNNEIRYGRYFLDCGTFISSRTKGNGNNNIDARFIDVDTGFYIDITGLALSDLRLPPRLNKLLPDDISSGSSDQTISNIDRNEHIKAYNCRNNHFAKLEELSPMKLSIVEGEPAYIPVDYGKLLNNEYGFKGLMAKKFKGYTFLPKLRIWVLTRNLNQFIRSKLRNRKRADEYEISEDNDSVIKNLSDEDYLKLLFDQDDLLVEYLVTRDITKLHDSEIKRMIHGDSTESLLLNEEKHLKVRFPALRHDFFNFMAHKQNYKYEDAVSVLVRDTEQAKKTKAGEKNQKEDKQAKVDVQAKAEDEVVPPVNAHDNSGNKDSKHPKVEQQTDEHLDNASINRGADLPPLSP